MKPIKITKTIREYRLGQFKDQKGIACSIQESSLATEPCIWFGISGAKVGVLPSISGKPGWEEINLADYIPGGRAISITDRMHLNQEQVAALLPLLQHFAETGELPDTLKD